MTAYVAAGHNSISAWRSSQPGVSEAAVRIQSGIQKIIAGFVSSATGQRRLGEPLGALASLYDECQEANWDDEGANPIPYAAYEEAENLLLSLPTTVPVPEFVPERSGRIAFEWYKRPDCVYLLSTAGNNELEFAAYFGRGFEIHGKCPFTDTFPSVILDHLREFQRR